MASACKIDRINARGQIRSTVYFRHPQTGVRVCDGTYPKKVGDERVCSPSSRIPRSSTASWAVSRSRSTPISGLFELEGERHDLAVRLGVPG